MNNIEIAKLAAKNKKEQEELNQYRSASQTKIQNTNNNIMADIKSERRGQGLTQRELAKLAGMSQASITRAERNLWVSYTTIVRIAIALGKELKII